MPPHASPRAARIAHCAGTAHDLTMAPVRGLRRIVGARRLVAILAALVVVLASVPGTIVCVGSDGHVAVEPPGADCGTAAPNAEASLHGCTDTVLGTTTLQGHSDPGRRDLCAPVRVAVAAMSDDAWRAEIHVAHDAPRTSPPAARSTVLLL